MNNPILMIAATAALWGLVWAFVAWARRSDHRLGRQAFRDGLPLNARWSRQMREGWGEAWVASARRVIK